MANLGIKIKGSLGKWNIFLVTKSLEHERGESVYSLFIKNSKNKKQKLGKKKRI